jgi:hypothetical protein
MEPVVKQESNEAEEHIAEWVRVHVANGMDANLKGVATEHIVGDAGVSEDFFQSFLSKIKGKQP